MKKDKFYDITNAIREENENKQPDSKEGLHTKEPCPYCGEYCFEGEGCDEYNAGGFADKEGLHTQGEWIAHNSNTPDYIDVDCNGRRICSLFIQNENGLTGEPDPEFNAEQKANAELIVKAVNERKALLKEIENLKEQKLTAMATAMEYGYKQCEKGNNLDMAFINFNKLVTQ